VSTLKLHRSGPGRLLCFDLENRPLAYWYDGETTSQITAFGWKWSDEKKVHTMLLTPSGHYDSDIPGEAFDTDDTHAYFRDILASADVVYGHNIRRHDLPILNSWLLRLELDPLPPLMTTDTLRDYPRRNGLSASLENLAAMYDLGGEKFGMSQPMWEEANKLTPDGVALARKRVASDVLLQERLREKLLSLGLLGVPKVWRP
jgi:hypothetical protein